MTGSDGLTWTSQYSGTANHLNGVIFGNSKFVAVGEGKIIYSVCGPIVPTITVTSPDGGESWTTGRLFFYSKSWYG